MFKILCLTLLLFAAIMNAQGQHIAGGIGLVEDEKEKSDIIGKLEANIHNLEQGNFK